MSNLKPRVLFVAWDGVRDDELAAAITPCLDALTAQGFRATMRVHPKNPTISGPVWATSLTGVHSDEHGITDNNLHGHRLGSFPDVLYRIRKAMPGASTFAAGAWAPLFSAVSGGPLLVGGGYRPMSGIDDETAREQIASIDEATTGRCAMELLTAEHSAVFAHFERPDMVAHSEGITPRYRAAIETCDTQLGVLLAAIDARANRANEEWTIIVATDHGHRDEGGHGGESREERNAWIVAVGPEVNASSASHVDHSDIAAHVLHALGLPVPPETVGRPFGTRLDGVTPR